MKAFRSDITGLRAIAVTAVMLFHAGVSPISGGFVGVDIFFVISGFLMTQIILDGIDRGRFSILAFWAARARRIVPALLVLCIGLAAFGWALIDPITYRELGLHVAAALSFVSNIQFWRESGYFDEAAGTKWLLHTWSLSVEWQFYLVYPLVLLGITSVLPRRVLVPLMWCGFVVSLVLSGVVTAWRPAIAFYMLPTRAWELLAGGLVLVHAPRISRLPDQMRVALEILGLATLAASVVWITTRTPWPSCWALIPVLGTAAVISADRGVRSVLNISIIQTLGLWSYSVYLWHWPVIVALRYYGCGETWWITPASIALGVGIGGLSYVTVERTSQFWLKNRPAHGVLALAACCVAAVMIWSALDVHSDGFLARARQPERLPELLAARADWAFPEESCGRIGTDHSAHLCRIGRGSDTGTLMIGDSHANQWYPRAANRAGADVVFLTRDGCPPLPGITIKPGPDCADFYRTALKAAADGHYRTIVFAAFWTSYLGLKADGAGVCIQDSGKCLRPGEHPEAVATVFASFARDLAPLAARSKIVIVLPDLEPPGDLPLMLAKRAFFGEARSDLEARPAAAVKAETAVVREALLRVAAEVHATTVDPLDILCGADTCPTVDREQRPLFRDSNHLRSSVVQSSLGLLDPFFTASGSDTAAAGLRPTVP